VRNVVIFLPECRRASFTFNYCDRNISMSFMVEIFLYALLQSRVEIFEVDCNGPVEIRSRVALKSRDFLFREIYVGNNIKMT